VKGEPLRGHAPSVGLPDRCGFQQVRQPPFYGIIWAYSPDRKRLNGFTSWTQLFIVGVQPNG
jgi:hypothetical protein